MVGDLGAGAFPRPTGARDDEADFDVRPGNGSLGGHRARGMTLRA
jgi:hypothetical protein